MSNELDDMIELYDKFIKDNRELRNKLFLMGLNEDDRKTYEDIRRRRIEYLENIENIDTTEEDKED